jgi:opacity protein-like surface antigen
MRASILIAIVAAASLSAAGAALAQAVAPTPGETAVNPPTAASDTAVVPAGGYASSDTLGDTSKLKAGDPNVVSNAPVPDTHDNRAKYGRPMSHAGRATKATGD